MVSTKRARVKEPKPITATTLAYVRITGLPGWNLGDQFTQCDYEGS